MSKTSSSTKILIVNSMTNGALNSSAAAAAAIFSGDGNGPVSSKVYNPSNHIVLETQFRECEKMYIKQCIQHYYQGRLSEKDLTNLCFQELNRRFNVKDVSGEEMAAKHFVSMIYNFYLVEMVKMIITSRIRKPNFQFKVINVTKLLENITAERSMFFYNGRYYFVLNVIKTKAFEKHFKIMLQSAAFYFNQKFKRLATLSTTTTTKVIPNSFLSIFEKCTFGVFTDTDDMLTYVKVWFCGDNISSLYQNGVGGEKKIESTELAELLNEQIVFINSTFQQIYAIQFYQQQKTEEQQQLQQNSFLQQPSPLPQQEQFLIQPQHQQQQKEQQQSEEKRYQTLPSARNIKRQKLSSTKKTNVTSVSTTAASVDNSTEIAKQKLQHLIFSSQFSDNNDMNNDNIDKIDEEMSDESTQTVVSVLAFILPSFAFDSNLCDENQNQPKNKTIAAPAIQQQTQQKQYPSIVTKKIGTNATTNVSYNARTQKNFTVSDFIQQQNTKSKRKIVD